MTHSASSGLAQWAPEWAHRFGTAARSGTASVFVLHGNTTDLFAVDEEQQAYGPLGHFLAEQAFGR